MRKTTIAAVLPACPKVTLLTANVTSTSIECLTLNVQAASLRIMFVSGSTYEYEGVPVATFLKVLESDSVGRAFIRLIKNEFTYKKV